MLQKRKEKERKKTGKIRKIGKTAAAAVLLAVLYVVLGVLLSYGKQPKISREYAETFRPSDCYSDTVSCDRACIIEDNEQALVQRLRMMEQAQERIILSTFEFRADESGKDMLAVLLAAAKRGVKVQVLTDGMTAFLRMDRNPYFYALAGMENVQIKTYNRLNLLMPWKSMGRLHDKYVITDDDLYLLGGRNTYDYFLGSHGYKNYDRDVLVYSTDPKNRESSIHQLEEYFASVWEMEACSSFRNPFERFSKARTAEAREELEARYVSLKEKYPVMMQDADYKEMTFETNKITLLSNPVHVYAKEPSVFYALTELMKQAQGEILIHTPYIICNDWMYASFAEICRHNPDTRLMTNSAANNGNPFGASDYLKHKEELLDTGLAVYEYEGGVSYHGKSICISDRLAAVGSFNMDMRSVYLDTELMLVIDSEGTARQLKTHMKQYEKQAVRALADGKYEIPKGVKRQETGRKKDIMLTILSLFQWLRFLM